MKQFHWKALNTCTLKNLTKIHVMTFNVHLAHFDVAPTRTRAGISLICDYLINCKICYVTLRRGEYQKCDHLWRGRSQQIMKFVWRNLWMAPITNTGPCANWIVTSLVMMMMVYLHHLKTIGLLTWMKLKEKMKCKGNEIQRK